MSAPDQFLLDAYSNTVSKVVDRVNAGVTASLILAPMSFLTDRLMVGGVVTVLLLFIAIRGSKVGGKQHTTKAGTIEKNA